MAQNLLSGCFLVGIGVLAEVVKHKLAPNAYCPNKGLLNTQTVGDVVSISLADLLAANASENLTQMRCEAKKALESYKGKLVKLEQQTDTFIAQANAQLAASGKKVSTAIDKMDLVADILLYQMAQANSGTLVYNDNFYNDVKAQVGKCGLSQLTKTTYVPTQAEVKKYGKEVDYRLDKLGYNEHQKSDLRDALIEKAANNACKGAKDSVKLPVLEGFFKVLGNVVEELLEKGAEIGIALLTGHIVDLDEMAAAECEPTSRDNQVLSKGPHLGPNGSLVKEAWALVETAQVLTMTTTTVTNAHFDYDDFEGSCPGLKLGGIAPQLVD